VVISRPYHISSKYFMCMPACAKSTQ
jgi:hypothetical protein